MNGSSEYFPTYSIGPEMTSPATLKVPGTVSLDAALPQCSPLPVRFGQSLQRLRELHRDQIEGPLYL